MNYFWTLLLSLAILTSCDDGDIIEPTFDFSTAVIQKCSETSILYKIKDKEALIFDAPQTYFANTEQTQTYTIGSGNDLMYRKFAANTSSSNVCDTPTLQITDEWNAIGGTIEIVSTKILNGSVIVAYNHTITFKNITFQAPDKQVVYDSYTFGNYRTEVIDLNFDYAAATTQTCPGNNLIFKYNNNSNNVLLFDVDASLFNHTLGVKTALINTTNQVVYRVYNGSLNANFFCSSIPPSSPTLTEEWVAENGVANTSGIIKVETTQETPTTYKHVIKLYNTTFKKGIDSYNPAPDADYTFGELITN